MTNQRSGGAHVALSIMVAASTYRRPCDENLYGEKHAPYFTVLESWFDMYDLTYDFVHTRIHHLSDCVAYDAYNTSCGRPSR